MANRVNAHTTAREIDNLTEDDRIAVLNYESQVLSSRNPQSKDNRTNDDVIMSLSNAYENKRARQVTEWEQRQRIVHFA
jgi:hypothetical protein